MTEPTESPVAEAIQSPAHVDTKPPVTGFAAVVKHFRDWLEAYFMLPVALLLIPGSALLIYALTGRAPQESMDWLLELAGRVLVVILSLVLVSISTEATGTWLTKAEKLANPYVYTVSTAGKLVLFAMFLYALTH
jgi:hypothetical protein